MAEVQRTKTVTAGDWRILEYGWNATFSCRFFGPVGAQVKVRYGVGWLGWDSQKKTLDAITAKTVNVGGGSIAYARVQMKAQKTSTVTYTYICGLML